MRKRYSTVQVARIVGVHKATLRRWLQERAIKEPKRREIAGVTYRVWNEADLEKVRQYKFKHYMKKPRKKTRPVETKASTPGASVEVCADLQETKN